MPPELSALQDVCARLNGEAIAYMLTGSLATGFYALRRELVRRFYRDALAQEVFPDLLQEQIAGQPSA